MAKVQTDDMKSVVHLCTTIQSEWIIGSDDSSYVKRIMVSESYFQLKKSVI